jgi:Mrp family chromosome partitioning ATPase
MSVVETHMHFLVWPKGNPAWEQKLHDLQPYAEELWNRIHASVPETAGRKCRVITVSGLLPEDGASTTAAALAHYAANEVGHRVLLVEANLRHRQLHDLGLCPRCPGFAGVLQQQTKLKNVVFELPQVGFHILPAGREVASPSTHVNPGKLREFLAEVEPLFDTIVFDGPPFTTAPETRYLVASSDATVPVIRSGRALPEQAAYWIAKIGEYRGRVGAVCLSAVDTVLPTRVRALL